jgi:hypothetical protein
MRPAPAYQGHGLARWVRALLVTSGMCALAGLSGVSAGDVRLRSIGIVGYVGVVPVARDSWLPFRRAITHS